MKIQKKKKIGGVGSEGQEAGVRWGGRVGWGQGECERNVGGRG